MGLKAPLLLVLLLPAASASAAAPPGPSHPEIRLVAVGDLLMHQDVKRAAAEAPGGFPELWADLIPVFTSADLVFGNLETPVAPTTGRPGRPFQFNAPASLPQALRDSGFTVLSTANNHAFDQGRKGLAETLTRLRQAQLTPIGSGETEAQAETPQLLERKGIKVAFFGFTDVFNMNLDRKPTEPWVRPLDLDSAVAAVRDARTRADVVVVSIHWGNEYQHQPTNRQRRIARKLVEAGCDLLLGHHPHVLQPMEWVAVPGRRALVAYSLGNFISNQDRTYRVDQLPPPEGDSRDGVALEAWFGRQRQPDGTERVVLLRADYIPLWTENNWGAGPGVPRRVRVVRLEGAEAEARVRLDQVEDPMKGPALVPDVRRRKAVLRAERSALKTFELRRLRIARVLGPDLAPVSAAGTPPAAR